MSLMVIVLLASASTNSAAIEAPRFHDAYDAPTLEDARASGVGTPAGHGPIGARQWPAIPTEWWFRGLTIVSLATLIGYVAKRQRRK